MEAENKDRKRWENAINIMRKHDKGEVSDEEAKQAFTGFDQIGLEVFNKIFPDWSEFANASVAQ